MCGLIGVAGKLLTKKHREVFQHLTLVNSLRGTHGCGFTMLFTEKEKGKDKNYYRVRHSAEPSSVFCYTKEFDDFVHQNGAKVILGHSRHATIGKVNEENCHPFTTKNKDIIGMHNGTIRGNFDKKSEYDTDSEAVYNIIEEKGLKEGLDHVYDTSYAHSGVAYAFQYYDRASGHVYIIRNEKRPLWFAYVDNVAFWASEPEFLAFCLARVGYTAEEIKFKELPVHTRVRINPFDGKVKLKWAHNWYTKPEEKTYTSYTYNGNNWTPVWKNNSKKEDEKEGGSFWFEVGPVQISGDKLNAILQSGCCVCGTPYSWGRHHVGRVPAQLLPNRTEFICEGCVDTAEEEFEIRKDSLLQPKRIYG